MPPSITNTAFRSAPRPALAWFRRVAPILAILLPLLLAGCANRYQITLNNNSVITTRGKPKLFEDRGVCLYKDAAGKACSIPIIRIKSIEPIYQWEQDERQGVPTAE